MVRVWIDGKNNVLADMGSRGEWKRCVTKHFTVPKLQTREVARLGCTRVSMLDRAISARRVYRRNSMLKPGSQHSPVSADILSGSGLKAAPQLRPAGVSSRPVSGSDADGRSGPVPTHSILGRERGVHVRGLPTVGSDADSWTSASRSPLTQIKAVT